MTDVSERRAADAIAPARATGVEEIIPLLDRLPIERVIDILIVQTLAYSARDKRRQALATLEQALMLAEPEGYIRIFVDAGSPIANLLAQRIEIGALNNSMQVYSARLLAAFPQGSSGFGVAMDDVGLHSRQMILNRSGCIDRSSHRCLRFYLFHIWSASYNWVWRIRTSSFIRTGDDG